MSQYLERKFLPKPNPRPGPLVLEVSHSHPPSTFRNKLQAQRSTYVRTQFDVLGASISDIRKVLLKDRLSLRPETLLDGVSATKVPEESLSATRKDITPVTLPAGSGRGEPSHVPEKSTHFSEEGHGVESGESTSPSDHTTEDDFEQIIMSAPDGLERLKKRLNAGVDDLEDLAVLDKILEWCQTTCQQASWHAQHGGHCHAEISETKNRLIQTRSLVVLMTPRQSRAQIKTPWEMEKIPGNLNVIRAGAAGHGPVTSDPYDPGNHTRIANLLSEYWQGMRSNSARSREILVKLQESLRALFRLKEQGDMVVCKWEAPQVFRQWYQQNHSNGSSSGAETSAAFQKNLIIIGSSPYFEATTLEDFITANCCSLGHTVLELITEGLMYAVKRDLQNGIPFQVTNPLETTYLWCSETQSNIDRHFQLLLFEEYVILGCVSDESRDDIGVTMSYICQALRVQLPKTPTSLAFDSSSEADLGLNVSGRVQLSRTFLRSDTTSPLRFQILTLLPQQNFQISAFSCWANLFRHSPIVVDYTTMRASSGGLKLPFNLMIRLAGVETVSLIFERDHTRGSEESEPHRSSLEIDSESMMARTRAPTAESPALQAGIVLTGFFTALIPVDERAGVVQWHLEYNDPSRSDSELINPYNLCSTERNWLKITDYESLRQKECILGWWDEAHIMLGTKQLENTVRFSKPSSTKTRSLHLKEISALGQIGTNTVVPLGIQGGATFQFVNNVQHFRKDDIYAMALMKMANDIAIVYDAEDHRGWLVPKLSLMLHMSHSYYGTVLSGEDSADPIPYAEPSSDGAAAALAALKGKGDTVVYKGDSDGDIALSSIIATLHTNICEANRTREQSKPGKLFATQYLDMVEGPAAGSDITITKTPSSIKAWLGILDRVGCVLVCAGLGEAIRSVDVMGKCTKGCNQLPCGKGHNHKEYH